MGRLIPTHDLSLTVLHSAYHVKLPSLQPQGVRRGGFDRIGSYTTVNRNDHVYVIVVYEYVFFPFAVSYATTTCIMYACIGLEFNFFA